MVVCLGESLPHPTSSPGSLFCIATLCPAPLGCLKSIYQGEILHVFRLGAGAPKGCWDARSLALSAAQKVTGTCGPRLEPCRIKTGLQSLHKAPQITSKQRGIRGNSAPFWFLYCSNTWWHRSALDLSFNGTVTSQDTHRSPPSLPCFLLFLGQCGTVFCKLSAYIHSDWFIGKVFKVSRV